MISTTTDEEKDENKGKALQLSCVETGMFRSSTWTSVSASELEVADLHYTTFEPVVEKMRGV